MKDNKAKKGIHDSKKARAHFTQELFFTKNAEAERILEFFNDHFGFPLFIRWKKRRTSVMGNISYYSGKITLFIGGDSIATLLHEIAHYHDWVFTQNSGHGYTFHESQDEILRIFDLHAHQLLLGTKPTNEYHADQIKKRAEKAGSDLLEELEGYVLIKEKLDGLKLDAEAILDLLI